LPGCCWAVPAAGARATMIGCLSWPFVHRLLLLVLVLRI
jgi:hypothetical protein